MTLYDMSVTPLVGVLGGMKGWMDKAAAAGVVEEAIVEARLAPDMLPFPRQIQIACDLAKLGASRLAGVEAPSMLDTEKTFAELKARCDKTIAFLESVDRAAVDGAADRHIDLSFPNGTAFGFTGAEMVTYWVLPNVYFHAATAYGLLRAAGVELGKADFLSHVARFAKAPAAAA